MASPSDWFCEGRVQQQLIVHLERDGWEITFAANAAGRQTGDDIAARKRGRRLVIEVKGYPSRSYRDPNRANEIKPTNPTMQAAHWYANALLKVVRVSHARPDVEVAMAFPDMLRYRSLIGDTKAPLQQLGIGIYLVAEDGSVEVVLRHRSRTP